MKTRTLPRRDILVLPALAIFTAVGLTASAELCCRALWGKIKTNSCENLNVTSGSPFRPGCTSMFKIEEGPYLEQKYNECGYLTPDSCGPKPAGHIRIAAVGSSYAFGYGIPYDESYPALTSKILDSECGKHIEVQDLGVPQYSLLQTYRRFDEAIALHPDLILLATGANDLVDPIPEKDLADRDNPAVPPPPFPSNPKRVWFEKIAHPVQTSRAVYMLKHLLYQDPRTFMDAVWKRGESADFLRVPTTPEWQERYHTTDVLFASMAAKVKRAGIPMVIILIPSTPQIGLLAGGPEKGADPYAIESQFVAMANKYDIPSIRMLHYFEGKPDVLGMFYLVDGHPNAKSDVIFAHVLSNYLVHSGIAAFGGCASR